jgi:hypothetical protein
VGGDIQMEGQNFCGVSVTPDCGEIEIQGIPALDFQLWFIDNLAELLNKSVKPKIVPKLFIADDVSDNQVVISPVAVDALHFVQSRKVLGFRLELYSNEEQVERAYAKILAMVKITINLIDVLTKRKPFVYESRFNVTQSGEARLDITITKST